uniref:TIGR00255 family protein n=1 Tax=Candidatus Kentrum sp. FM TaxID=2126340 RepID=A0A450U1A5_9GAMM|nr:MAG: TIGR00255 family protein [Candidatus Kentron sp. FM]VFJ76079.1 MAG: TIGR00255 family protein [Candidatus Kentron sp. FM]VFK23041.1 MAG: TIGR00255 family protein [Candidatus Kentron sp. FM]
MIYSMTAFVRQENQDREDQWGGITWEIRSVNHRYLDITVRLPEELRSLEPVVRERVRGRVSRGKVECLLRYSPPVQRKTGLHVNTELAKQVVASVKEIAGLLPSEAPISALEILRWPGVVETPVQDLDTIRGPILDVLDDGLAQFIAMRAQEGEKLVALLKDRHTRISAIVTDVRTRLPAILVAQRARLTDRLSELNTETNPDRLEQELVLFAQKMDVAEELDRLDTHLAQVGRTLREESRPDQTPTERKTIGRRLDFLMQEMHREANTLSAKSVDKAVTAASVELRVLIEQMREQIQNVE